MSFVTPLNEAGQPVDWWFLYKVPELQHEPSGGLGHACYDPVEGSLRASVHRLLDGQSALDRTLAAVFATPRESTGWILYNDELPADIGRPDDDDLGHTKGVLAFDVADQSALWLLHSWPKFIDVAGQVAPSAQYGQTFLCLSMTLDTAQRIAAMMIDHQQPQVYAPRIPAALDPGSALHRLSQGADPKPKADSEVIHAETAAGHPFTVLAKNRQWGRNFWIDLVGPTLQDDLDVDTWIRGAIPSTQDSDGQHQVHDVKQISLESLRPGWTWPETHDHAKWGVGRVQPWVCVGDINRMVSQERRGGGAVAFQDAGLWTALRQALGAASAS
jgi:deoxyribonuclease-2